MRNAKHTLWSSVTRHKTHTSSMNSDILNFPLLDHISQALLWVFQGAV